MSDLIIGVGGTGRGVITWLKYYLKRDFEFLQSNMNLFVIDGPDRDTDYRVIDPLSPEGELVSDFSATPHESYQLSYDCAQDIQKIREGNKIPHISDWLSQNEAEKIKGNAFDPKTHGFGASRGPAKACFYKEADKLRNTLNGLMNNINGLNRIILVGSLVGGTGAGMLNEIAALLRDSIEERTQQGQQSIKLYGITALARGFDSVFNTPETKQARNARCFAGIREVQRQLSQKAYDRQITNNITLKNLNNLYDVSILVDNNQNLGVGNPASEVPANAICNAIGNGIILLSSGIIGAHTIQWENNRGVYPRIFRSFGDHIYIYSPDFIINIMAYRFVKEFYGKITSAPATGVDNRIVEVFASSNFSNMVMLWYNGAGQLYLNPPQQGSRSDFSTLITKFSTLQNTFYESSLKITDKVQNRGGWFGMGGMTNGQVIRACESNYNYLFSSAGNENIDLKLQFIYEKILGEFEEKIWENLYDIFTDKTNTPHKPKDLRNNPNCLKEAHSFLRKIDDILQKCIGYFSEQYQTRLQSASISLKQSAHADVTSKLNELNESGESKKNADEQDEFKVAFEQKVYIEAWEKFIAWIENTLNQMKAISNKYWVLFGQPAEGWFSYIEKMNEDSRAKEQSFNTQLHNIKDALPFTRYLPRPYDKIIEKIYKDQVADHLDTFLMNSNWQLTRDQITGKVEFLLSTPNKIRQNRNGILKPYLDVLAGGAFRAIVDFHHWMDVFEYCRAIVDGNFRSMDIWDAFAYDYKQWEWTHENIPNCTPAQFSNSKIKHATKRSSCMLPTRQPLHRFYITGNSTGSTKHGQNMNQSFSQNSLQGIKLTSDNRFSKMFLSFECNVVTPDNAHQLEDWPYFDTCLQDYFKYNQIGNQTPVHNCPEERYAFIIENELFQLTRQIKLLDPSVTAHLGNPDNFRLFWLAELSGLMNTYKRKDPNAPHHPGKVIIPVFRNNQKIDIVLGNVGDYGRQLYKFLDSSKDATDVRNVITEKWSEKLKAMTSKDDDIELLIGKFSERTNNIKLDRFAQDPNNPGDIDIINRDDLIDAIWVSLSLYVEAIRAAHGAVVHH